MLSVKETSPFLYNKRKQDSNESIKWLFLEEPSQFKIDTLQS